MKSLYKSAHSKSEIFRLYDEKLSSLNLEYRTQQIETQFGQTNVIITGNPANPPLIAIHGSNGCAPVALETYGDLKNDFCIYAVDVLAQPNKSAETRLSIRSNIFILNNKNKY